MAGKIEGYSGEQTALRVSFCAGVGAFCWGICRTVHCDINNSCSEELRFAAYYVTLAAYAVLNVAGAALYGATE